LGGNGDKGEVGGPGKPGVNGVKGKDGPSGLEGPDGLSEWPGECRDCSNDDPNNRPCIECDEEGCIGPDCGKKKPKEPVKPKGPYGVCYWTVYKGLTYNPNSYDGSYFNAVDPYALGFFKGLKIFHTKWMNGKEAIWNQSG